MKNELWKDIKDYEGLYQISNYGEARSFIKNKILKSKLVGIGYKAVNLCKNGTHKSKKIHRLVAEAFIPNPNNYPCVNHKNGNKLDNRVENLEWCTYSYNNKEAYRLGLKKSLKGKNNNYSKSLMKAVNQYDMNNNLIKRWESKSAIDRELHFSHQNILKCVSGQRKTAYGYIWKYEKLEEQVYD